LGEVEPNISDTKYEMEFTVPISSSQPQVDDDLLEALEGCEEEDKLDVAEDEDEPGEASLNIGIKILKVDDTQVCVEFTKRDGDKFEFNKWYTEVKDHFYKKGQPIK